jgi:hypothetical protein
MPFLLGDFALNRLSFDGEPAELLLYYEDIGVSALLISRSI